MSELEKIGTTGLLRRKQGASSLIIPDGSIQLRHLAFEVGLKLFSPGMLIDFCGTLIPNGFLPCDGSAIDRLIYADLFEILGVLYGAGDSVTTFNLPDHRSRVSIGAGTGPGLNNYPLSALGGEENHTLTTGELAAHGHNYSGSGGTGGISANHTHAYSATTGTQGVNPGNVVAVGSNPGNKTTGTVSSDHTHGYSWSGTTDTGGTANQAHNNLQPYLVVNKIIKY